MKRTSFRLRSVLILILMIAACGSEEELDLPVINVSVASPEISSISAAIYVDTRLEGIEETLVYATVPGRIEEVLVVEGDSVTAGQHLVKLDSDQGVNAETIAANASVSVAKAYADNAQTTFDRLSGLYQAGAVSEQQMEDARAAASITRENLNQAYAVYALTRSSQSSAYVTAAFSGKVGRIWARTGNTVSGEPLLSISNTSEISAQIMLPEIYLFDLSVGLPAYVTVQVLYGESFPGIVTAVSSSVDPVSGKVPTRITFHNPDGRLRSGMSGRVCIITEIVEDVLLVPENILRRTGSGFYVAVVENGITSIRSVEIGIRSGGMAQILSGIEITDSVIVEGQFRVKEGSPVSIRRVSENL